MKKIPTKQLKGKCTLFFGLLFFLPLTQSLAQTDLKTSTLFNEQDTFMVSGLVIKREEVWDRRPNPMMGRPDFLIEVIFQLQVNKVLKGNAPDSKILKISAKGEKLLIASKKIRAGKSGNFKLQGNKEPFALVSFELFPGETILPVEKDTTKPPVNQKIEKENVDKADSMAYFEGKGGKEMKASKELQEKCKSFIARKYGMKNVEFISLTSFSGPCPPEDGYIYWGVRGLVKGKWYVWQAGMNNGKLTEGKELEDPKRYQKCNSPDTKIQTPSGPVPISILQVGDLVISSNNIAVPLLEVVKVKALNHYVCKITFDDGFVLEISPDHPLADGKIIGSLQTGDLINGKQVLKNERISYKHKYTFDILPDSETGTYFVGGIELGSTLRNLRVKN